jgi:hypothetical protein
VRVAPLGVFPLGRARRCSRESITQAGDWVDRTARTDRDDFTTMAFLVAAVARSGRRDSPGRICLESFPRASFLTIMGVPNPPAAVRSLNGVDSPAMKLGATRGVR